MKQVSISGLKSKNSCTHFGYLAKAPSIKINERSLGGLYTAIDQKSSFKKTVKLITFIRLCGNHIPELYAYHSEGKSPEECQSEVLKRSKAKSVNDLAYYLYENIDE